MLRPLPPFGTVQRAAADPDLLGYYLYGDGPGGICVRLDCEPREAVLLQLYATPDPYEWRRAVRTIARDLRLDPDTLGQFLAEAVARRCSVRDR